MKRIVIGFLLSLAVSFAAFGQWNPQKSNTTASLHGLSIVNANVVWASGTGGTLVRATDGGETWQVGTVPSGEKLDFRDVYAVDAKTAYLMSPRRFLSWFNHLQLPAPLVEAPRSYPEFSR